MAKRKQTPPATFAMIPRGKLLHAVRRIRKEMGYAGFRVVKGNDQRLRERATVERGGEDDALSYYERSKFQNLVRNGVRNSETLNTILKQFELNVVGTVGGKASFALEDLQKGLVLRAAFARYCRSCEYFDGLPFGDVLKKTLITYLTGGDLVLYFDPFSGKIVAFEPDCISNIRAEEFARRFQEGWTQRQGRVYNEASQFCGVICSHSQRGRDTFDIFDKHGKLAVFFLRRDPLADPIDEDWVMIRHAWRFNQGRGTPPFGPALGSIIDLEDVTKYEVQAAKHNAQTIGQIYQTSAGASTGPMLADGIDPDAAPTDWSAADESAVQDALTAAQEEGEAFTFDEIRGAGVIFNKMPASAKMELLDTKHPNANMPEFIRWLAGRSAASLGVGSVYATLKADASYTAFRGEQVMSWPAFEDLQKFLEQKVCDWVLNHWAKTSPEVAAARLPDGWMQDVAWQWPTMREVNQVDEQNAISLGIKNFIMSYREKLGPNYHERLEQIAREVREFKELGLTHPAMVTVSGAVVDSGNKEGAEA